MEITNGIKTKLFASYIGQQVDVSETEWYQNEKNNRGRLISCILNGVANNLLCLEHNIVTQNNGRQYLSFDVCKLILKQITSITDEDAIEVAKLQGFSDMEKRFLITTGKTLVIEIFNDRIAEYKPYQLLIVYQFLQAKGYDLPQ